MRIRFAAASLLTLAFLVFSALGPLSHAAGTAQA